jgi:hypothetical protein
VASDAAVTPPETDPASGTSEARDEGTEHTGSVPTRTGGAVSGVLTAYIVWGFFGLPLLTRGPQGVKDMFMAKFLNKVSSETKPSESKPGGGFVSA